MGKKPRYPEFGQRLKLAREALGYDSAAAFALQLGWSDQTYRNFERGDRYPNLMKMRELGRQGISVDWLIMGRAPAVVSTVIPIARETA